MLAAAVPISSRPSPMQTPVRWQPVLCQHALTGTAWSSRYNAAMETKGWCALDWPLLSPGFGSGLSPGPDFNRQEQLNATAQQMVPNLMCERLAWR